MPVILAFDLATATGVAVGDTSGAPDCFTVTLGKGRDTTHADKCADAMRMTNKLIKKYEPDLLAIEAPFIHPKAGFKSAAVLLYQIKGAVIGTAKINGLHAREYTVAEIRKHFISNASLGRAAAKSSVIDVCGMLGWSVSNDNEADAAAVWEFARADAKLSNMMPAKGLFGTAKIKGG